MNEEIRTLKEILNNNDLDNYTIDDDECYLNGYARKCLKKVLEEYVYHGDYAKEIERLNNIINELEEWLKKEIFDLNGDYDYEGEVSGYENVLDKLQELKGSDKE